MKKILIAGLSLCLMLLSPDAQAQRKKRSKEKADPEVTLPLQAFKMRNIGPAFLSGRISDIVFHPDNENVWYVATGSGGVWKTENAGTTWNPLFDGQASYSIGCIALDPSNPEIVWVGTGENVGGRHVAYGDGIYRSADGGNSWKNMGLPDSQHISEIIVHPDNSDVVWVAVQGPLWNKGGERGVYKTTDGGNTWKQVLGNNEWTGATDLILDPRDPQVLYAATWDRHRTVAAYLGGGPGSGIHKSTDGGETWTKLTNGLPRGNMGKIGMAQSPQQPDVLYAAIELDLKKGAVYRSDDQGASWKKMSNTVSGGTGPHYYQELYASPHKFDRLYLMDVRVQTSEDGGKTFTQLPEAKKHSDNHAIAFKKNDPDYIMLGTDAGIYESFDLAENWRYIKNLPLTQFYKVAVNNAEPFYHIFGGTQDNGSAGGPSATDEREGIANKHWYKTLFADGHQSATDPEYNDIIYAETQQGGLHRIDLTTGEQVAVQPQASPGEPHERFNWDAPILVSPHNPETIYFASYRVWRSDNRGDSWTPISGDLTRNEERFSLPIMGRQQSFDNAWDVNAMSNYNTITSLSESPVKKGLIYAGTDDGFIQVTENGGESWRKIPVTQLGLPGRSFVNDIKADLYDENTVYVALDNHKEGDFNPYLFKSTDKGRTWKSIASNLPKRTLVWRMVQDHVKKNLLFAATEFGIYTSLDGGGHWQKLGGTPNMSFRDLVIQKRENDLVAASFGRGFFVLDDYSALRDFTEDKLKKEGVLFAPRTAKWHVPRSNVGNTGADYYFAPNPEFGAVFTYHLANDFKSAKAERKKAEKALDKEGKDVPFPGWEALDREKQESGPMVWLTIKDAQGNIVKHLKEKASKGSHRIAWDLTHANRFPINPDNGRGFGRWFRGAMVTPGTYTATLYLENDGAVTQLDEPVSFEVKPIRKGVLQGVDHKTYNDYITELSEVWSASMVLNNSFEDSKKLLAAMKTAASRSNLQPGALAAEFKEADDLVYAIEQQVDGSASKNEVGERNAPNVSSFMQTAMGGMRTTYGPTPLHLQSLEHAKALSAKAKENIDILANETLPAIEARLKAANAPVIMK
ncbi:WD40/YVTN/BNR-like repeat-containing protein [Robertkochia sediminum]|uniref:WD40/YVTN/BNR-like repeat-containing protein n=1 Tax=Robertkochia sediminum TaxID=2785326 RepID=UPI001F16BA91|nr:glycosyl hydrolase [Robertkochia sediminum]MBL7471264.1 glycosyl hydrolase [Robertkochia sediminum]